MIHYKFPKIQQYRQVGRELIHRDPDTTQWTFQGTVKLHGSNTAVVYNTQTKTLYAQSRNKIITPDDDNYGFAAWAQKLKPMFDEVYDGLDAFADIIIYGEWVGEGIQQGTAMSQLSKRWVIFDAANNFEDPPELLWGNIEIASLIRGLVNRYDDVFAITDYPTYKVVVNPYDLAATQNTLTQLTAQVEAQCPVGAAMGVEGIGEGIVWRTTSAYSGQPIRFKVKGEKHSKSKVKTLSTVDSEALDAVDAFIEYAVTPERLQQGFDYLTEMGLAHDRTSTGEFIKWVMNDIFSEENDIIDERGIDRKMLPKSMSAAVRNHFFSIVG